MSTQFKPNKYNLRILNYSNKILKSHRVNLKSSFQKPINYLEYGKIINNLEKDNKKALNVNILDYTRENTYNTTDCNLLINYDNQFIKDHNNFNFSSHNLKDNNTTPYLKDKVFKTDYRKKINSDITTNFIYNKSLKIKDNYNKDNINKKINISKYSNIKSSKPIKNYIKYSDVLRYSKFMNYKKDENFNSLNQDIDKVLCDSVNLINKIKLNNKILLGNKKINKNNNKIYNLYNNCKEEENPNVLNYEVKTPYRVASEDRFSNNKNTNIDFI